MSLMTSSPTQSRRYFLRLGASLALVLGVAFVASPISVAQDKPPLDIVASTSKQALFQELQKGGLVIYFRHGRTNKGGVDRIDWPRHEQRLLSEGEERAQRLAYSQALVTQAVPVGQNRIIVGHSSNISKSTGRSIGEGDAVVLRSHSQGPEVLAVLSPEDWDRLAD